MESCSNYLNKLSLLFWVGVCMECMIVCFIHELNCLLSILECNLMPIKLRWKFSYFPIEEYMEHMLTNVLASSLSCYYLSINVISCSISSTIFRYLMARFPFPFLHDLSSSCISLLFVYNSKVVISCCYSPACAWVTKHVPKFFLIKVPTLFKILNSPLCFVQKLQWSLFFAHFEHVHCFLIDSPYVCNPL